MQQGKILQLTLTEHGDGADAVLVGEAVVRPRFGSHLRPQRLCLHRRDGKLHPELVPPVVLHVILCSKGQFRFRILARQTNEFKFGGHHM